MPRSPLTAASWTTIRRRHSAPRPSTASVTRTRPRATISRAAASLDKLAKFRAASGDSSSRRAEAGFLLAEQYLFQLDKPERAIDAYASVVDSLPGTPWAGKARSEERRV